MCLWDYHIEKCCSKVFFFPSNFLEPSPFLDLEKFCLHKVTAFLKIFVVFPSHILKRKKQRLKKHLTSPPFSIIVWRQNTRPSSRPDREPLSRSQLPSMEHPHNIDPLGPVSVGGLQIHSPKVYLLTAVDVQLTAGTPSFTVAPSDKSFSPLDFWFGCVARTGRHSPACSPMHHHRCRFCLQARSGGCLHFHPASWSCRSSAHDHGRTAGLVPCSLVQRYHYSEWPDWLAVDW